MVAIKNANARREFFCSLSLSVRCWMWIGDGKSNDFFDAKDTILAVLAIAPKEDHHIRFTKLVIFKNFQCIHFWSKNHCLLLSNELHNFITNGCRSRWNRFYLWPFCIRHGYLMKRKSLKWTNSTGASFSPSCSNLFVVQILLFGDFVYRDMFFKTILACRWREFVYVSLQWLVAICNLQT